jgi:hypothetical protein
MTRKKGKRGKMLEAARKKLQQHVSGHQVEIEQRAIRLLEEKGFDSEGANAHLTTPELEAWLFSRFREIVLLLDRGENAVAEKMAHVAAMFSRGEYVPDFGGHKWLEPFLPKVLPPNWREDQPAVYMSDAGQMVLVSGSRESDGNRWVHMSTGFPKRLPSWEELKEAKNLIFGPKRWAVQVLPPEDKYVNIAPYVLHLFHCVDADVLPDFTGGTGSL